MQVGEIIFNRSVQLLSYADDIDLVARSYAAVSDAFLALDAAARRVGLIVNEVKTCLLYTSIYPTILTKPESFQEMCIRDR